MAAKKKSIGDAATDLVVGIFSTLTSFLTSRKFWSIVAGALLSQEAKKRGWDIDPEVFTEGSYWLTGAIAAEDVAKKLKIGEWISAKK